MLRNEQFVKKTIGNSIYLLPIGQMIADMVPGIRINSTCAFVWEQLKTDITFNELLECCIKEYAATDEDIPLLEKDIAGLITQLKNRGMLKGSKNIFKCSCSLCSTGAPIPEPLYGGICRDMKTAGAEAAPFHGNFYIGGLQVDMYGKPGYFAEAFESFRVSENSVPSPKKNPVMKSPMHIEVIDTDTIAPDTKDAENCYYDAVTPGLPDSSDYETHRKIIIHHPDLTVLEYTEKYVLFFTVLDGIEELHLKKDGSLAYFYCKSPSETVLDCLFNAIRMAFLIYALHHDRVMLHSCSILFNDKVWAFSAPSGTGKSTHAGLWEKLYGVSQVNGDLNLIGMECGQAYTYGTPWCGSSGVYDTGRRRLGGIILLKRGSENRIATLTKEEKILHVEQRLITSVWDEDGLDRLLKVVTELVSGIYVRRLYCTMDDEAAIVIHDDIEKYEGIKTENTES